MSLAALNIPGLIASAGAAALAALPIAEQLVAADAIEWTTVRAATAIAYTVQIVAVSVPGRIDGEVAKAIEDERKGSASKSTASKEGKNLSPGNGRTLVAPAGWAFAIWGPIFLGEFVFVASQAAIPADDPLVPLLKKTAVPFIFAHTFQSLWCAAFRRKYSGNLQYISFAMLSATAFFLSKAHAAFASASSSYGFATYLKLFLPISMHCGWTVAASLVNLNGAFSMLDSSSPRAIAWLGHISVAAATAIGVAVTTTRSAPVFGGVITWALLAVADGMKQRLEWAKKTDATEKNIHGATTQRWLSLAGGLVTGLTVIALTAKTMMSNKDKK